MIKEKCKHFSFYILGLPLLVAESFMEHKIDIFTAAFNQKYIVSRGYE